MAAVGRVSEEQAGGQAGHGGHGVPLRFSFEPALYGTLALSVAAVAVAVLFGGSLHEIRVQQGTSKGQIVH